MKSGRTRPAPAANDRGETIVEVAVAFVLLLLFIGVFGAAIRFSHAMTVRASETRSAVYESEKALHPGGASDPAVTGEDLDAEPPPEVCTFRFSNGTEGFSLSVMRGTRTAGRYTYHEYAPAAEAPAAEAAP